MGPVYHEAALFEESREQFAQAIACLKRGLQHCAAYGKQLV